MIKGSCLCGAIQFEVSSFSGPFELCHCSRCRKASGTAFLATIVAKKECFRFTKGQSSIKSYALLIKEKPPAYTSTFCSQCGSPVPNVDTHDEWLEIPAGLLDGDPELRPDKHIFIENKASWDEIVDDIPQFTKEQLHDLRKNSR